MIAGVIEEQKDATVSAELEDGSLGSTSVTQDKGATTVNVSPVREIFCRHPLALLIGTLGTAGIGAFWYVPPFLGPSMVKQFTGVPSSAVSGSEVVAYIVPSVLAPLVGTLVDK